jgi:hypothetical protein
MKETHQFNEELNRFEPFSSLCEFCETNHEPEINNYFAQKIYGEKGRKNLIVYSEVSYTNILVLVARCASCKKLGEERKEKFRALMLFSCTIAYALSFYFMIHLGAIALIFVMLITMMTGFFAVIVGNIWLDSKIKIRRESEVLKKNSFVQYFIAKGWSLHKPQA